MSDAKYFSYIAKTLSLKNNISYESAVIMLQKQIGIEWSVRDISTIMGITQKEVQTCINGAIRRISLSSSGAIDLRQRGQMTMFFHQERDFR